MFSEELISKSLQLVTTGKNPFTPLESELFTNWFNDSNSSKLRERITANVCGYKSSDLKLGRDCIDPITNIEKEIKPQLFTGNGKHKLNGTSNFSDYHQEKFDKDLHDNLPIIHSTFAHNRLLYIVEYSFSSISNKLQDLIHEKCVVKGQRYVRTASWGWKHWIDDPTLKFHYFDLELIKNNKQIFVGPFYNKLIKKYSLMP